MNTLTCTTVVQAVVKRHRLTRILAAALLLPLSWLSLTAHSQSTSPTGQAATTDASIPSSQLLQPADLAKMLHLPSGERPLVLQVGSHVLFSQAHVPGSEYVGAAGQDVGLQALRQRVQALPRNKSIVIYCGCCPWGKCPNIRPAYRALVSMGFTHVKVLYLQDNFGADWVAQHYPTAKGD